MQIELRGYNRRAEQLFNMDTDGVSRVVYKDEWEAVGLGFTNGRDRWARNNSLFFRKYNIVIVKRGTQREVLAMQSKGFRSCADNIHTRTHVPLDVKKALAGQVCVVLAVQGTENDHKDGFGSTGSKPEDFQRMTKTVNDVKRDHCNSCKRSNRRFDARILGYSVGWIDGDSYFTTDIGCKGCYWNDPKKFNQVVSENFAEE